MKTRNLSLFVFLLCTACHQLTPPTHSREEANPAITNQDFPEPQKEPTETPGEEKTPVPTPHPEAQSFNWFKCWKGIMGGAAPGAIGAGLLSIPAMAIAHNHNKGEYANQVAIGSGGLAILSLIVGGVIGGYGACK